MGKGEKNEISWIERMLLRAVYRIGLFLMTVIAILLIFGFFALLAILVWLLLVTVV